MAVRNVAALLALTVAMTLSACGNPEQASEPAAPAAESAADEAVTETAPAPEATPDAAELASIEESVGDEAEAAADEAIQLSSAAPAAVPTADWKYKEGSHFRRLTTSQGTSSPPDKIEVAEIFWYGCNHCYNFDPIIDEWKANTGADVSFVRIPVVWNPTNQIHARLMYTAEALGVLDQAHPAAFAELHQKGNMLTEDDAIIAFFAKLGVSEEDFREAYGSFGVTSALKRAENLTRRYGIRSVPILVVNGKYVTEGTDIKSFDDLLNVTDELVARERAQR